MPPLTLGQTKYIPLWLGSLTCYNHYEAAINSVSSILLPSRVHLPAITIKKPPLALSQTKYTPLWSGFTYYLQPLRGRH